MVTLKDIASSTGVSYETVSRILNGKYKGRTSNSRRLMKRILSRASKLGYRPNNAARAMRTSSSRLIGLVMEESCLRAHPVVTETLSGINESLEAGGYIPTITSLSGIRKSTLDSRIFREHLLDGIIIMDDISTELGKDMSLIIPACVMINMNSLKPYCCIRRDEFDAGLTAGRELRKLGYRKAVYFDSRCEEKPDPNEHYSAADRLSGFMKGFKGSGNEIQVVRGQPGDIHGFMDKHLMEVTRDTVLVAAHDLRLFSLIASLSGHALRAGKDCGIVTLDDEAGFLSSFPNLSRVSFPRYEIGRKAGQMMVSLLQGRKKECKSIEIKGEWICGTTTPEVD